MVQAKEEAGILRTVWSLSLLVFVVGWYITGSATLGFESKWLNRKYIVHRLRDPNPLKNNFTEEQLALYDGRDSSLPIYLAVDGMVFDVSAKPETYGLLGPYGFFSGKDASRAFATGCFQTDLTHDLRGLSEDELRAVKFWQDFFNNHQEYWHIGYVNHPPLTGEPPVHCKAEQRP